ncbi:ATP-dependent DNA helicase [soil metagenome]
MPAETNHGSSSATSLSGKSSPTRPEKKPLSPETRGDYTVERIFEMLAESLDGYEVRDPQLDLAHHIERAFNTKKTGIFEAGTGVGKSFAALIPAFLAGKKVVVSTATIALQEQYMNKDIPILKEIFPFEINAALLKGRGNYLGIRRFRDHVLEQHIDDDFVGWVNNTQYGDVSELDFVPPYDVWGEINSDSDDCLRNKCPSFASCFYFEARKRAEKADILVVNHALLLADAASGGSILPPYQLLIVDEAHHLPDIATDAFSRSISNRGIRILLGKAVKRLNPPGNLINDIEHLSGQLFVRLNAMARSARMRLREPVEGAIELIFALKTLRDWLENQTFEHILDVDLLREKAQLKAKSIISTISGYCACLELIASPSAEWVMWLERTERQEVKIEVVAAPLDPSHFISDLLLNKAGLETSVWMSATLATAGDDPFEFFKRSIDADRHVIQSQVPSPFDFENQALLYLPPNMPEPNHPDFFQNALIEIERIIELTEGRAFVLFTSKAALNNAYQALAPRMPYEARKQGDMPRQKLVEWFKATPHAVLFGTSSFWEGVSIDGEQLSCVIIDRIPFQVPDDPVYEARCEQMKEDTDRSWFNDLALPHATMRLKQGVGRLIRTKKDRGLVAILDSRLTKKYYGRKIIECLPPMKLIRSLPSLDSHIMEDFLDLGQEYSG